MSSSTPHRDNNDNGNTAIYRNTDAPTSTGAISSSAIRMDQLLSPERILIDGKASSKRDVLTILSEKASFITGYDQEVIFDLITEREKLGSTGVGEGVAIPHGKIKNLTNITGFFLRTQNPIDFDAIDHAPVDLFFLLLAPENATAAHLKSLAKISRLLRSDATRDLLRKADTQQAIYAIACEESKSQAA